MSIVSSVSSSFRDGNSIVDSRFAWFAQLTFFGPGQAAPYFESVRAGAAPNYR